MLNNIADPIAFLGLTFVSCLTGIPPASGPNLAAGLYHGVFRGSALFLLGAVLAALAALLLVRVLFKAFVLRKMAAWEDKRIALDTAIANEGAFTIVALLRLSPAMPLAPANVLLGLTNVGLVPYTLGTLAGLLPFSIVYTYVGSVSQQAAAAGGDSTQTMLQIAGVLATVALTWKISKVAQGALDSATVRGRRTSRKAASPTRRVPETLPTEVAPRSARQLSTNRSGTAVAARPSTSGKDASPARVRGLHDERKATLHAAGINPKTGRRMASPIASPARGTRSRGETSEKRGGGKKAGK
jgi:uncharacterized membrane protein YdjX (TVP38/TMEM64 family)